MNRSILLTATDAALVTNVRATLERRGNRVDCVDTAAAALAAFAQARPEVVITDADTPDLDPIALLDEILTRDPRVQVVFLADASRERLAGIAIERGAHDWLTKPLAPGRLTGVLERAARVARAARELEHLRRGGRGDRGRDDPVAASAAMRQLCDRALQIAADPLRADRDVPPVLITGEAGVGKRALARVLHREGPRRSRPFIEVDCADPRAEHELFGVEAAGVWGAPRIGLIEAARGGTLLLRRVDDASPAWQERLVELVDQGRYRRHGASRPCDADVQLVATSRAEHDDTHGGAMNLLRAELRHRLGHSLLHIPPLRDRVDDIGPLAQRFVGSAAGRRAAAITSAAISALRAHSWPGNVHELRRVVEHGAILARGATIEPEHLSLASFEAAGFGATGVIDALPIEGMTLADIERQLLLKALRSSRWNVSKAARDLGLSRDTMRYRIEKFQLRMAD